MNQSQTEMLYNYAVSNGTINPSYVDAYVALSRDLLYIRYENGQEYIFDQYNSELIYPFDYNGIMDENRLKKDFSFLLRRHMMLSNGMTEDELASKLNITRPMVSRYMSCKCLPSYMMLVKLSNIFNCSIDDFRFPYNLINATY